MLFLVMVVCAVAAATWWISTQVKQGEANVAKLGGKPGSTIRYSQWNYLGGNPGLVAGVSSCNLLVTAEVMAIEKGPQILKRVSMDAVTGVHVETESEASQRITATRVLAAGIFALAIPKKTAGSVLITFDTSEGPFIFEKPGATRAAMLQALAPVVAMIARS